MKMQIKKTITLSAAEVKEAVREYINLHSVGDMTAPENFNVFMIVDGGGRQADVEIEAQIFE